MRITVDPDDTFDFHLWIKDGPGGLQVSEESLPGYTEIRVTVRQWSWHTKRLIRQEATVFNPETGAQQLNFDKYTNLKLRRLLHSWTLEDINPKLKILHVEGVIPDEVMQAIGTLPA